MLQNSPITIYTQDEVNRLRQGGRFLAEILNILKKETIAGISTLVLDQRARELCDKFDSKPAFLNYTPTGAKRPFPISIILPSASYIIGRPYSSIAVPVFFLNSVLT